MDDNEYMQLALGLAQKGLGFVNPNPMVGAVIVKNKKIIGTGYHERYGALHAEPNAFSSCTQSAEGATLYVTLEPCCHYGKTPPCTDVIIKNKISKVVVGSQDPNPFVAGKGLEILKQNGIEVEVVTGVLEKECMELNKVFFHYIKTKTPYVVMKYAMTLDGKIATSTGESRWITGEQAREHVHLLRHKYTAIMVGVETVIVDNPMLDCRLPNLKSPVRIICDTNLRIPLSSKIVQTARDIKTYIACSCENIKKIKMIEDNGCHILQVEKYNEHINLKQLMNILYEKKIDSILLEGGSTLNFSAFESGIVKKVYAYVAPKILGGAGAKTPVGGLGIENLENAFYLTNRKMNILGEDILFEYDL